MFDHDSWGMWCVNAVVTPMLYVCSNVGQRVMYLVRIVHLPVPKINSPGVADTVSGRSRCCARWLERVFRYDGLK